MKIRFSFAVFVYFVAANIPVWIASRLLGFLPKGLFNVEFAIIGILSVFLRRSLIVVLLLSAILLDILSGISWTYMLSGSELLRSTSGLFEFAPSHGWDIAAVAICSIVIAFMAVFATDDQATAGERISIVSTLGILTIVCVMIDIGTGQIRTFHPDRQLGRVRLTREPVRSLLRVQGYKNVMAGGTDAAVAAASTMLVGLHPTGDSPLAEAKLPNLVLVLVESWGKPLDASMDASLLRPYSNSDLAQRYSISRGTVPFYGPTVDGEARELCGSAIGFGILTASVAKLSGCLPVKLDMMGYHSIGVHGFTGRMFERDKWYGRIGFDETWFRDRFKRQGLPVCPGPFPGICDAAVSTWIGDRLEKDSDSPQFIYWVTLNSHLPVPVPNLVKTPPPCPNVSISSQDSALCSWYQLIFNVHRSVSELALRSLARPTVFVVVGDHAPPFTSPRLRSQFSDQVVPYVLLMPKTNRILQTTPKFAMATTRPVEPRRPHHRKGKALHSAVAG
jgi:hypothetical protein